VPGEVAARGGSPLLWGLSLSIDYYDVMVSGAIGAYSALQSVTSCFNIDGANPNLDPVNEYCANITRYPNTGWISSSSSTPAGQTASNTMSMSLRSLV
jgi:hypothetical protein